jgi:hypothetical protein
MRRRTAIKSGLRVPGENAKGFEVIVVAEGFDLGEAARR